VWRRAWAAVVEEHRRQGARQRMFHEGSGFCEFDTDAKKREKASIRAVMMRVMKSILSYQADDDNAMNTRGPR
jgi:hypothetical protein